MIWSKTEVEIMKKKKYTPPALELSMFRLTGEILLSSIEHKPIHDGGGEMVDPSDEEILDWGGF